jgi:hypothetical protein
VRFVEFLDERFLDINARDTLINEWDTQWTERSEGVHSLGWEVQEEFQDNYRRKPFVYVILRCEGTIRGTLILSIPSPILGVNCC